jgi:hypothetical protein
MVAGEGDKGIRGSRSPLHPLPPPTRNIMAARTEALSLSVDDQDRLVRAAIDGKHLPW